MLWNLTVRHGRVLQWDIPHPSTGEKGAKVHSRSTDNHDAAGQLPGREAVPESLRSRSRALHRWIWMSGWLYIDTAVAVTVRGPSGRELT